MKHFIFPLLLLALLSCTPRQEVPLPQGKAIYIPEDLRTMDLQDPASDWSYHRMYCTPNLAIFWQRGFGDSLSCPPPLDGQPMAVDLPNLASRIETFYSFFRDTLQFHQPGTVADSTRMMVMLNYSLEGTAYGGTYDDHIGALWLAPNRVQDQRLNCIAHELGHSFQCQIGADRPEGEWQVYGFYEMASQWMLWQVNPDWITDEHYHYEAFLGLLHKAFLAGDNVYHSPYILQSWSDLRGRQVIAQLFKEGRVGEDPVMTYKRLFSLSQQQMCDELFDACRHFVGLDYHHAWAETRPYAGQASTPYLLHDGWLQPDSLCLPENYGFNVFPLLTDSLSLISASTRQVSALLQPLTAQIPAAMQSRAGWRFGFVAQLPDGTYAYSPIGRTPDVQLRWQLPSAATRLWLVVMAAPNVHWRTDGESATSQQWPYRVRIS